MTTTHDLHGRVALVTGAAGDIGRACALRLARSGAVVAAADVPARAGDLDDTVRACGERSDGDHLAVPFDVTDEDAVDAAIERVVAALGAPSLLVNSAGYQGLFRPAHDYPVQDAQRVVAVNVIGVMAVTGAVARHLTARGAGGAVVNIASHAGVGAPPNMPAYAASKAAVIGYTHAAAVDLAPYGVRVNAVSPAFIGPGEMWQRQVELQAEAPSQYYADEPSVVEDEMVGQVPLRRLGSVDEVAATVVWLLSDDASYVTGENVLVTGGIV